MKLMLKGLLLGAVLTIGTLPAGNNLSAASPLSASKKRVVVAEDKTTEAECRISVNFGPEYACPPGSVVWTRTVTYAEAQRAGIKDYIMLTDDPVQNKALQDELASRVSARIHGVRVQPASCRESLGKWINGRYRFSTGWEVAYQLFYKTDGVCNVFGVTDQTRTDGTTGITWNSSCTDAESAVNRRCNIWNLGVNGNWTAIKSEQNSFIMRQYRHNTSTYLHSAYGFYYFG